MTSGGGALTAEQLSVEYRGAGWRSRVLAVRNATLRVNAGEVVGLVGESGSGKSSVARALVGLAPVTAGVMQLDDTVLGPSAPRSQRRLVQMVFQNPRASLNPRRTVRQALTEALAASPARAGGHGTETAEHLLAAVSLPVGLLDRLPHQMSGGQCQRVAIARALAAQPHYLLADEVTAALDATVAAGVVSVLRRLANERRVGVLLITHDLRTVEWIADSVAVMYLGEIVEQGPAADVLNRPLHPYTAALLAARPSLHHRRTEPLPLVGDLGTRAAAGCQFAPRCPFARGDCHTVAPIPTRPLAATHVVACHHPLVPRDGAPAR